MSRVLVVDDELGVRDLFREILVEEGHETLVIERGRATLEAVREFRPDLLLLDLWLRDTDGLAVLESLREHAADRMPAVIVMSGRVTEEDERRARALGARDLLEKPVALARLLRAVRDALAGAPMRPAPAAPSDVTPSAGPQDALTRLYELPLREAREGFERDYFRRLLERHQYNVTQVARVSGMERTNLYRKLKQLGLGTEPDDRAVTTPAL